MGGRKEVVKEEVYKFKKVFGEVELFELRTMKKKF